MKKGGFIRRDLEKALGWLRKKSPLPKVNKARKAKRSAADRIYGSYFRYVGTLPCAVRGEDECFGNVVGHHLKTVAAGGEDAANLAPLCQKHHRLIHDIGTQSFDDRFFNSLPIYALVIWGDYHRSLREDDGA